MFIFEILQHPLTNTQLQVFAGRMIREYGLKEFIIHLTQHDDISLGLFVVGEKKQGTGTKVMLKLCELADQYQLRIILNLAARNRNFGTTSSNRLMKFYKRFGFVENKGRKKDYSISDAMYREPNSPIG